MDILQLLGLKTTDGNLQTVNVDVSIDNESIWKLSAAIVAALVAAALITAIINKHSK